MKEYLTNIFEWVNNKDHFAVIIAMLAFLATACQARAAYVQNRQSVRPYLHVGFDIQDSRLLVVLENAGLGPAIIDDFYIEHNSKKHRDDQIGALFGKLFPNPEIYIFKPGAAIAVGNRFTILGLKMADPQNQFAGLQDYLGENYELVIKYRSFLGKRHVYRTFSHSWPKKIERELKGDA